ncbi:MAG: glycosyl hydrolase 108 family protein [Deltaproteobacteria bacterium]
MDAFEKAIAFVLRHEGGYVHDPRDPGGETKFGISKRAYPNMDMKALTEEQAKSIYKRDYWLKGGCDNMEWPLCLVHFDACVNIGIAQANKLNDRAATAMDYLFLRIEFYCNLKKPEYLRGWINRVIDLWKYVLNAV